MRSIRTRLLLFSTSIVAFAFLVTSFINISIISDLVSIFKDITNKNGQAISSEIGGIFDNNKQKIVSLIEKQMTTKSHSLLRESELVFAPAFSDGSFSFISQLLSQRIETDEDIVYAAFFAKYGEKVTLWTLSTKQNQSQVLFGAVYNAETEAWTRGENTTISDKGINRVLESDEQLINKIEYEYKDENDILKKISAFDISTPVYSAADGDEEEQIGYLRYIISLESMNALLLAEDQKQAQLKKNNEANLVALISKVADIAKKTYKNSVTYLGITALSILIIASLLFYLLANKITIPLLKLKDSAITISEGNYNIPVKVTANDEVGILAQSFEQMREKVKLFTEHLQELVDQRTAELREALSQVTEEKQKIQEILTHIEQGIIMFDEDFIVTDQYSDHVKQIYSCDSSEFVGANVFDFLFKNSKGDKEAMIRSQEAMKMAVGDDNIAWIGNKSHFIHEATVEIAGENRILTMNWHPILDEDDFIIKVICSFMDVTERRALEKAVEEEKQKNRKLIDAITKIIPHDPAEMNVFLKDSHANLNKMIIEIESRPEIDDLSYLGVGLHTIKGNSRMFELNEVTSLIHDTETIIREKPEGFKEEALSKMKLCLEIFEVFLDVMSNVLKVDGSKLANQTLFSTINQRIGEIKKKINSENMTIDSITCEDGVLDWDSTLIARISDMLTHSIANAIDHGYVFPQKSGEKEKPFKLKVSATKEKGLIQLNIKDWGAGINYEKLREIAKQKNFPFETEEELNNIIFGSAVSTAESVSQTSGRGDGMAAVKGITEELGGYITIFNAENAGANVRIQIPITKESTTERKAS